MPTAHLTLPAGHNRRLWGSLRWDRAPQDSWDKQSTGVHPVRMAGSAPACNPSPGRSSRGTQAKGNAIGTASGCCSSHMSARHYHPSKTLPLFPGKCPLITSQCHDRDFIQTVPELHYSPFSAVQGEKLRL